MKMRDKLLKLVASEPIAKVARRAKVSPSTISNLVNRGSIPRADNALLLARALNVPLEWLVDDLQGWPPPPPNAGPLEQAQELVGTGTWARLMRMAEKHGGLSAVLAAAVNMLVDAKTGAFADEFKEETVKNAPDIKVEVELAAKTYLKRYEEAARRRSVHSSGEAPPAGIRGRTATQAG